MDGYVVALACIAAVAFVVWTFLCLNSGYNKGYRVGSEDGHQKGYELGLSDGLEIAQRDARRRD
jgi:hypothetical protein